MTPTELILNGLYAACDNAHDMGLKDDIQAIHFVVGHDDYITTEQYAICVIVDDICSGSEDGLPECAYLDDPEIYSDDPEEEAVPPCKRLLRLALPGALVEFYRAVNEDRKKYADELKQAGETP